MGFNSSLIGVYIRFQLASNQELNSYSETSLRLNRRFIASVYYSQSINYSRWINKSIRLREPIEYGKSPNTQTATSVSVGIQIEQLLLSFANLYYLYPVPLSALADWNV